MFGTGFKITRPRVFGSPVFDPLEFYGTDVKLLTTNDPDTMILNGKSAQFTAANSEYLSSLDSAFDFTSSFTAFGWFKCNTISIAVMSKYGSAGNRAYTSALNLGGNATFSLYNTANTPHHATSTITILDTTWYLFFGIYDAATGKVGISINNETIVWTSFVGTNKISTAPFNIGQQGTFYSSGFADGSGFYNKAVSQSEISEIYASGEGIPLDDYPDQANIVEGWKLNEESGTRAGHFNSIDLTDNNTVTFAAGKVLDGIDVSNWNDQSTFDNDPSQATLANMPHWTVALLYILYDGIQQFFDIFSVWSDIGSSDVGSWSFRIKDLEGTGVQNRIFDFMSATDVERFIVVLGSDDKLNMILQAASVQILNVKSTSTITRSSDSVITITTDGTTIKMYQDAVDLGVTFTVGDGTKWLNDLGAISQGYLGKNAKSADFYTFGDFGHLVTTVDVSNEVEDIMNYFNALTP